MTKRNSIITVLISFALIVSMILGVSGCAVEAQAADLMENIKPNSVSGMAADNKFIASQDALAAELFKACAKEKSGKNVLVSPLSVALALAMTANGANGETKAEMEALLGGGMDISELNEYFYAYAKRLAGGEKSPLKIANSIWFRDDGRIAVNGDFLQTNADYYSAQAYKRAFDGSMPEDINRWVKEKTDGMIGKIIDGVDGDELMYLINALAFEAEWETPYEKNSVTDGSFTCESGEKTNAKMMYSVENSYIETENAVGIRKNYKGGEYSFAALLPNEETDIYDFISSLSGDGIKATLGGAKAEKVVAAIPKFSAEYGVELQKILSDLGMKTAFDGEKADFGKMGSSDNGKLFIDRVIHKTFIEVDENGTKAAAASSVIMKESAAEEPVKSVILDRPFVYMIVDNSTNLPLFIGTALDIGE